MKADGGARLGKAKEGVEQGGRDRAQIGLSCGSEMGRVLKIFFLTVNP